MHAFVDLVQLRLLLFLELDAFWVQKLLQESMVIPTESHSDLKNGNRMTFPLYIWHYLGSLSMFALFFQIFHHTLSFFLHALWIYLRQLSVKNWLFLRKFLFFSFFWQKNRRLDDNWGLEWQKRLRLCHRWFKICHFWFLYFY